MASFQRTFQKSHNAEYHSLQGVEVRIGKRFTTPKKVTLPVGWQQRDPSLVLGLTYDFSFEKEVISKAEALKVKQTEHKATTGTESETTSTSVDAHQNQNAIFSNVGNEILQPVVAAGMGHRKKDSFGGKGNNSFDLADFEGDTSTPFELVELQTINDLDELKNVLEPCTAQEEVAESFITSNDRRPADVPSSNVGNQCPSRNSIAEAPAPVVKPTALPSTRQLHSSCKNYSVHGASGCTYTNSASKGSYLVNIGDSTIMSQAPAAMSTSGCTVRTTSYATNPLFHSTNDLNSRPVSRGGLLPPLGSSQPWPVPQPYQTSTCVSNSSHSHNQGIYTAPTRVANREQYLDTCAKGNEREALITYMKDNPGVSSPSSRSSEHQNAVQFCPSPLPPIGLSSEEPRKHLGKEPHVSTYQSGLPDPWPVLTDGEKSLVTNIASMGFPTPRVSRGVQRIGLKEGEVIEFLVAVDELSGAGYEPDSAEVALVFSNSEKAKAVEFLELVHTFKEYGFEEENIQEALQAANSDREKALEYLMTLSTG